MVVEQKLWGNSIVYPRTTALDDRAFEEAMKAFERTTVAAIEQAGYEVIPGADWNSKALPVYVWAETKDDGNVAEFAGSAEEFRTGTGQEPTDDDAKLVWHSFVIPVRKKEPEPPLGAQMADILAESRKQCSL